MSRCEQLRILSERHRADLRAYQQAMALLDQSLNTPDFKAAYEHVEACRETFDQSREAVELHTIGHGCGLFYDPPLFQPVALQKNAA